jgi:formate hydrogenlyase subunit 3/multisubunit Na+/H+ antiporter MnhD subunit
MTQVSRRDRQADLVAVLIIAAGAAVYLFAAARLHTISMYSKANPGPPGALDAADRARFTSYAGVALITVGCLVSVAAAALHQWRRRADRAASAR